MADSSRNPKDQLALTGVEEELAALRREQSAVADAAAKEGQLTRAEVAKSRQQAEKQGAQRRAAVPPGGVRSANYPLEAAAVKESTSAFGALINAEAEALRIAQQRLSVEKQTGAAVRGSAGARTLAAAESVRSARIAQVDPVRSPFAAQTTRALPPVSPLIAQAQAAERASLAAAERQALTARSQASALVNRTFRPPGQLALPAAGQTGTGLPGGYVAPRISTPDQRFEQSLKGRTATAFQPGGLTSDDAQRLRNSRALGGAYEREGASHQRLMTQLGGSSQILTRNGALTTEFIAAAAKGQVTFRELGSQVGLTIGKFAGWTGAATAVYAAVGAFAALGRGAKESLGGVALVSRVVTNVDASKLQGQFRGLSREFNVPIKDSAQAVYGAGKIFQDQNDAVDAAKAALFAQKVAELDAAQGLQYLAAISHGFALGSGKELLNVLDAINQVQNKFGGNTGDLVKGVAKAGGAIKALGGNYKETTAFIEAGNYLTGSTPQSVGTALSRSAGRVATKQGAAALSEIGIDPTKPYFDILKQAFKLSKGASAQRVQEIARALVPQGGQFARIFVPILQNPGTYRKILEQTQPKNATGSASRELTKVLAEPGEQIKRIGIDFERFGSVLGQSGVLGPVLLIVKGLDAALNAATGLLGVFSNFSGPIGKAAITAAELVAVLKVARRFDLGGSLPQGRQGGLFNAARSFTSASPNQTLRAGISRSADERLDFFRNEQETARTGAARTSGLIDVNKARNVQLEAEGATEQELLALQVEREKLEAKLAQQMALGNLYQERIVATNARQAEFASRTRFGKETSQAVAQDLGITHYTPPGARATGADPHEVGRVAPQPGQRGAPGQRSLFDQSVPRTPLPGQQGALFAEPVPEAAPPPAAIKQRTGLQRSLRNYEAGMKALGSEATVLQRAVGPLAGVAAGAGHAVTEAGSKLKAGAAAAAKFSAGPLDALILGFIAYDVVSSYIKSRTAHDTAAIAKYSKDSSDPKQLQKAAKSAFDDKSLSLNEQLSAYQSGLALAHATKTAQAHGALLPASQIATNLHERGISANTNLERIAAVEQAISETQHGFDANRGNPKAQAHARVQVEVLRGRLAALKAATGSIADALNLISDDKGLQSFLVTTKAQSLIGGPTKRTYQKLGGAVTEALKQYVSGRSKPTEFAKTVGDAQQQAQEAATTTLNQDLAVATTPAQRHSARTRYAASITAAYKGLYAQSISKTKKDLADARKHLATDQAGQLEGGLTGDFTGGIPPSVFDIKPSKSLQRDKQRIASYKKLLKALGLNQTLREREAKVLLQESKDADRADQQAIFDATTGLLVAREHDPTKAAKIQLARDTESIRRLAAAGKAHTKEYIDLLAKAEADRQAIFQDQLDLADAQSGLAQARTVSPVGKAQIAAGNDLQKLGKLAKNGQAGTKAYVDVQTDYANQLQAIASASLAERQAIVSRDTAKSDIGATQGQQLRHGLQAAVLNYSNLAHSGTATVATLAAAQQAIYQAEGAIVDYQRQQAEALIGAQAAFASSKTEDPVKQARIAERAAERLVKFARTPSERLSAKAQVNTTKTTLKNTIYQGRYDTIEFDATIGKITAETEIARLTSLEKSIKGDKALKRQILERIHALKKEAETSTAVDLNVGSIKLPTIYEIRRAIATGKREAAVTVSHSSNVTVVVNDKNQVGAVAEAIDKSLNTTVRSSARAAGLI